MPERPAELLNPAQHAAAHHGIANGRIDARAPALLIVAGAGTGKTHTLAHRAAKLVLAGADPLRILLLTFTRRAAREMTRRAQRICAQQAPIRDVRIRWSGTFHAIANRLLRLHAPALELDPAFTLLDRGDAADALDLLRDARGLSRRASRFPRKATCLAIYSHTVSAQRPLEQVLHDHFPWCETWVAELRGLFAAYVDEKQRRHVLDYDDLLLGWYVAMSEPELARQIRERFDHVLVDEYQDTNALQVGILRGLRPDGRGLCVVGDDAQAIYSFRAADPRNLLAFPGLFEPPARVVTLEENYRSVQPILDASGAVIGLAREGFTKNLRSERRSQQRPVLACVADEAAQVEFSVERILEHREAGIPLRHQAVLMRTAHHSDALEVELARRDIPFVKFGGLRFLEAAHVKDLLCVLRWAENPRDASAGFRVLQILPGIGPAQATRALAHLERAGSDLMRLADFRVPPASADDWPELCRTLLELNAPSAEWPAQVGRARLWYEPHLERLYDSPQVRAADLEQLEQIAAGHASRERFLSDLALDPPSATGDEARAPYLDEDYLILSTIHSAKGQEWDVVYVLNVVDGCIPSDLATANAEQIDEERRLLYVAMTRARDHLYLIQPLRFFVRQQPRHADANVWAPRSRFLPDSILQHLERQTAAHTGLPDTAADPHPAARIDLAARLRSAWS